MELFVKSPLTHPHSVKWQLNWGYLSQPLTGLFKIHCKQNCKKKCKVHKLNAAQIEKRQHSWQLYKRLNCDKRKNFVTTNEAVLIGWQLWSSSSATSVKGIMILQNLNLLNVIRLHQVSWLGQELVSAVKTEIPIIPKGVKVNSQFYIDKVFKPFIKHDAPKLFPDDQIKDMVFYQDSASSRRWRIYENNT